MKYLTVVLLVFYTQLITDGLRADPNCTFTCNDWEGYDTTTAVEIERCLHWSLHKESFPRAEMFCEANGGTLFLAKTRSLFFRVLAYGTDKRRSYWIGLHDVIKEGEFVWLDGTPLSRDELNYERYWMEGGPDNAYRYQHCVVLRYDHWGLDDDNCYDEWHYVCESRS